MALVEEYKSGNCTIRIYDDHCVKTKAEVQKILDEVSEIYSRYFSEHPEDFKE